MVFRVNRREMDERNCGRRVLRAAAPALSVAAIAIAGAACSGAGTPKTQPTTPTTVLTPTTVVTTTSTSTTSTTTPPPPPASLTSSVASADQVGSKPYRVSCTYPVLVNPSNASAAKSINAAIFSQVSTKIATFEHYTDADQPMPVAYPGYSSLTCTWSKTFLDNTLGSVSMTVTTFPEGAAHPIAIFTTFTFDPSTGHTYQLSDLFQPGSDYLQVLSSESRSLLSTVLVDVNGFQQTIQDGTAPTSANFAAWQLEPAGMLVRFQEYQVGPYVAGAPTIVIPYSALMSIANPSGPLSAAPGSAGS